MKIVMTVTTKMGMDAPLPVSLNRTHIVIPLIIRHHVMSAETLNENILKFAMTGFKEMIKAAHQIVNPNYLDGFAMEGLQLLTTFVKKYHQ